MINVKYDSLFVKLIYCIEMNGTALGVMYPVAILYEVIANIL